MENNKISDPNIGQSIKDNESVGEEFIKWAEKYWHLDKLVIIEHQEKFGNEVCNYDYMRNIFIEKINAIIKDRL